MRDEEDLKYVSISELILRLINNRHIPGFSARMAEQELNRRLPAEKRPASRCQATYCSQKYGPLHCYMGAHKGQRHIGLVDGVLPVGWLACEFCQKESCGGGCML